MGVKAFLSAAVPVAITGLPGGPVMLQELSSAWADMGLRDKDFSEVLSSVKDEGKGGGGSLSWEGRVVSVANLISHQYFLI